MQPRLGVQNSKGAANASINSVRVRADCKIMVTNQTEKPWPRCTPTAGTESCQRAAQVEFVLERFGVKRIYRCVEHARPMRKALATLLSGYRSSERPLALLQVAPR